MNLADFQAEANMGNNRKGGKQAARVITDAYDLMEELGHGAFGSVYRAVRKDTAIEYAVKHIDKKRAGSKGLSEVFGEVETLGLLDHPYIVRLEETFEDPGNLWIVMEYVAGGELQTSLKETQGGRFPEPTVKKMVLCLLLAIEYIHRKGIVHRDLKPANCLLSVAGDVELKLADFGFSVMVGKDACLKSFCGTTTYMAPEILLDMNYGRPVDMWAVGVIAYVLLSGTYPFPGSSNSEVVDKITQLKYEFPEAVWGGVSLGARDFISKLLVYDQTKRLTAHDALRHVWVQTGMSEDDWEFYGLEKGQGGGAINRGTRRKPPRLLWRGCYGAVRAVHRIIYFVKCRRYKREGVDYPFTHNFGYMVSGVFNPRSPIMNVSGLCPGPNLKVLNLVLDMVESSSVVDTLDVSNNNIDHLDFIQNIVRVTTTHPALTSLNLEGNPIPPLAGRALVRLARTTTRLRVINTRNTTIGAELTAQIAQSLKESEKKRLKSPGLQHLDGPSGDGDTLPSLTAHHRSTPTLTGGTMGLLGLPKAQSTTRLPSPGASSPGMATLRSMAHKK
jgi:hypothetical protein